MFEGEKWWKIRKLGQITRQWSKLIALTPSDRNSDRRGMKEIRGKTEASCSVLHGLYRLLCQHEKVTPNYETGQDVNGRDIEVLCRWVMTFFLAGSRCSYSTETATWWFGPRRWCKVVEVSLHSHQSRNDRWGSVSFNYININILLLKPISFVLKYLFTFGL